MERSIVDAVRVSINRAPSPNYSIKSHASIDQTDLGTMAKGACSCEWERPSYTETKAPRLSINCHIFLGHGCCGLPKGPYVLFLYRLHPFLQVLTQWLWRSKSSNQSTPALVDW
ncbi:hypothetical protein M408DRAFT_214219 [Serendipita vermifera MAFF 305830]|uniref:Uncharacterized protein n=1 Tax=Serendipita vermifera MAFF 305830 TaxID=933852 RepID=A0A0C3BKZ9_SERVB|nr:hypothetical protein M408DRAFT_214219 [Serendipita vermifera MAFF 305830]